MRRIAVLGTALAALVAGAPSGGLAAAEPAPVTTLARTSERAPRLVVPAIGVNARIIPVGVTRSGDLAIGRSVTGVYRWRAGVVPGRRGSAVLAGHTWSRGPGVFDNLGRMRVGQRVRVGRAEFRVTRVRRVTRLPRREVRRLFSDQGPPRLVLITCGDRNNTTGVYRTRIIVNARKVAQG